MSDPLANEVRALRELFLAHAGKEEQSMQNIDASLQRYSEDTRSATTAQLELAAVLREREKRETKKEEDARNNRNWFQRMTEKYAVPILVVVAILIAPEAAPLLMRALGVATPVPVVVEQPAEP